MKRRRKRQDRQGQLEGEQDSRAALVPAAVTVPPGRDPNSIVLTFPVSRDLAGLRLDRFIQQQIPRLSRTRAQHVVKTCAVRADGASRRPSDIVQSGEIVVLVRERFEEPDVPRDFDVVYEDDMVLALSKPSGLPMHRTATYHRNTLTYVLRERYGMVNAPRIAHRLDRETSGLVLCAKTRSAERALQGNFEAHRVSKRYLAIVKGVPSPASGTISLPMAPVEEGLHVCMEVRDNGSPAQTEYRVRAQRGGYALVQLAPKSGRQHQLRVHLAAIGSPIVGDKLYGPAGTAPFLEVIEHGLTPDLIRRLGHERHALHAHGAVLPHPNGTGNLRVTAPLPPDLRRLWHSL